MGRAVLAWSGPARRDAILRDLVGLGRHRDALAQDRKTVDALVTETLAKGYATRLRGYYITHRREADVSAIALPITIKGEAVGSVNLSWVSSALNETEFAARYLDTLAEAARDINEALAPRFDRLPESAAWQADPKV
jgi:IclR family mhp operon transcriptional activator